MKFKLIAFSLGTVLIAQAAQSQTSTAGNANPGGPSTGGNNTAGTPPAENSTAASTTETNAASSSSTGATGSTANNPQTLPPTTRSVTLKETDTTAGKTAEAPQSDQQIKSNIRQTLATEISSVAGESYSSFSGRLPITCDVQGGVATLMGSVGTQEQKEKIELIVQRVPGVTSVENLLQVSDNSGATAASGTETNRLSPTSTRTNGSTNSMSPTSNGSAAPSAGSPADAQQRRQQLFPNAQTPR
jgi:hypothetical protein